MHERKRNENKRQGKENSDDEEIMKHASKQRIEHVYGYLVTTLTVWIIVVDTHKRKRRKLNL